MHLTVKIGPVWKFQSFYPSGPPKPKIGPAKTLMRPRNAKKCFDHPSPVQK